MKIYVASSWRNPWQPGVVALLRTLGHEPYDFREPAPGVKGFGWSGIDPNWKEWNAETYRKALLHPLAEKGFKRDMDALVDCGACLLVQPCGTSAHLELGWAIGAGKRTAVLFPFDIETPHGVYEEGNPRNPTGHTLDVWKSPIDVPYYERSALYCPACSVPESDMRTVCQKSSQLRRIEPELMVKAAGEILLSRAELESWLKWEKK